jgi:hypothetical protein
MKASVVMYLYSTYYSFPFLVNTVFAVFDFWLLFLYLVITEWQQNDRLGGWEPCRQHKGSQAQPFQLQEAKQHLSCSLVELCKIMLLPALRSLQGLGYASQPYFWVSLLNCVLRNWAGRKYFFWKYLQLPKGFGRMRRRNLNGRVKVDHYISNMHT